MYFCPIDKVFCNEAVVTDKAGNRTSLHLKDKLHQKKIIPARTFRLDHGILFCRDNGALCITVDMRCNVMSEAHESPLGSGHQGAAKTMADIASKFYWPHQTQPKLAWARGYDVCHSVKHSKQLQYGLLQPWAIPVTWVSMVIINFSTQLPATARDGNDCIVTILDPPTMRA